MSIFTEFKHKLDNILSHFEDTILYIYNALKTLL